MNEAFARKFNLGQSVIGARMARGEGGNRPLDIEIVGPGARCPVQRAARRAAAAVLPALPPGPGRAADVLCARGPVGRHRRAWRRFPAVVARLDPNLPVGQLSTMTDRLWERHHARPDPVDAVRVVRRPGDAAGGGGPLRGAGLRRRAARARDGHPHGARGHRRPGAPPGVRPRQRGWPWSGRRWAARWPPSSGRLGESLLFGVDGVEPRVLVGAAAIVLTIAFAGRGHSGQACRGGQSRRRAARRIARGGHARHPAAGHPLRVAGHPSRAAVRRHCRGDDRSRSRRADLGVHARQCLRPAANRSARPLCAGGAELGYQHRQAPPVQPVRLRDRSRHHAPLHRPRRGKSRGRDAGQYPRDRAARQRQLFHAARGSGSAGTYVAARRRNRAGGVVGSDVAHELRRRPVDRRTDHHARTATARGRGSHTWHGADGRRGGGVLGAFGIGPGIRRGRPAERARHAVADRRRPIASAWDGAAGSRVAAVVARTAVPARITARSHVGDRGIARHTGAAHRQDVDDAHGDPDGLRAGAAGRLRERHESDAGPCAEQAT